MGPRSTVSQGQLGQTRPVVLDTRTSKAMSSTALLCVGGVANDPSPRVPLCVNPRLPVVSNNKSPCETFNQLLRNVLGVVCLVENFEFLLGWTRLHLQVLRGHHD